MASKAHRIRRRKVLLTKLANPGSKKGVGLAEKRFTVLTKTLKKTNPKDLIVCSWNIQKGLIKREEELKDMLNKESIDIMFLMETDNKNLITESDFQIEGSKQFFIKEKII